MIEQHDTEAQQCSQSADGSGPAGAHFGQGGEAGGLLPSVAEHPHNRPRRQAKRVGDDRRFLTADSVHGAAQVLPGGRGGFETNPVEPSVVDQHAGVEQRPPEQRPQLAHGADPTESASIEMHAAVVNRRWWSRTSTPVPRPSARQDSRPSGSATCGGGIRIKA